jgi:hypothetical protein
MKIANKITSILCDDVRHEVGHKTSLMGIYDQDIIFDELPALLPKLCLFVRLEGVGTDFQECKVTLKTPEMDPVHLNIKIAKTHIGENVSLFAIFSPFRAKSAGQGQFEVRFDERKRPSHVYKFNIATTSDEENSKKS